MPPDDCRRRFSSVPVACFATVTETGAPHLIPVTFALPDPTTLVTAVDHKPKRTRSLRRLANIAANPLVSVLAQHYSADWSELWWVRIDGVATVTAQLDAAASAALVARYPQYLEHPPQGPLITVAITRFSGWSAV